MRSVGTPTVGRRVPHSRSGLIVTFLASGVLLALAFRGVDLPRVTATVLAARPEYLALAVLLDLAVFLAKSLKWRLIVLPLGRLPVSTLFSGIAVGSLASNVLPFRLDELVRAFYLGRRGGISRAAALGTIVIERIVDATMLLVAIAVLLCLFSGRTWLGRGAVIVLALLLVAAGLTAGLLIGRARLAGWLTRIAPASVAGHISGAFGGLVQGMGSFPRGLRLILVFACAAAEWAITILYMKLVLAAFDARVPLGGVLLLVAAGYLSFALPSGPGGLGVFELLVKGSLVAGSLIDPSTALGIALVLHALLVVPISLLGIACLAREGIAVSQLRELEALAPPAANPVAHV
jgi:uncharacterized protein (TIRG00374 family)